MANSLVERMMKIDRGLIEPRSEQIKAQWLSEAAGEDIFITIKGMTGDDYMSIASDMLGSNGQVDTARAYDAQALLCVDGVVDPSLKDKELQKHFGAATPKDLAKTIFPGGELSAIANEIGRLSGFIGYELVKN